MTNKIMHEALGIDFEVPEMSQRVVEDWARVKRNMRKQEAIRSDDALEEAAEAVLKAVKTVIEKKLRVNSPEAAAAVDIGARAALRVGALYAAGGETSAFEVAGVGARAAAKLGWLGATTPDEVNEWSPAKTAFVTNALQRMVIEAHEIPPN